MGPKARPRHRIITHQTKDNKSEHDQGDNMDKNNDSDRDPMSTGTKNADTSQKKHDVRNTVKR